MCKGSTKKRNFGVTVPSVIGTKDVQQERVLQHHVVQRRGRDYVRQFVCRRSCGHGAEAALPDTDQQITLLTTPMLKETLHSALTISGSIREIREITCLESEEIHYLRQLRTTSGMPS